MMANTVVLILRRELTAAYFLVDIAPFDREWNAGAGRRRTEDGRRSPNVCYQYCCLLIHCRPDTRKGQIMLITKYSGEGDPVE